MTAPAPRISVMPRYTGTAEFFFAARRAGAHVQRKGLPAALALASCLGIAACGSDDADMRFAPTCPTPHIPAEVGDYYAYAGGKTDFAHLIMRASITRLGGDCIAGGPKMLKTRVGLHIVARRGPAPWTGDLTLPWFVAVVHNDKIVGKHVFIQPVTFPANVSTVEFDTPLTTVDLPVKPTNGDNDYRFELGFQLTPAELAYNRDHGVTAAFK
ncbi:hypothetical protein [Acetobacter nitrogenifigens]|nr:hypothetical protein [Acetobacter nitrogenifigens]